MLRRDVCSIAISLGLAVVAVADETRLSEKPITAEDRAHWAFRPPERPAPPAVHDRRWVRNPIDRFIAAKRDAQGLAPSPEAERPTLLRRLSFDLTGLPPSPDEIDTFLNDRTPDAEE